MVVNNVVDLCLDSEEASSDLEIVGVQAADPDKMKRMHSTGSMDLSYSFNGEEDEDYAVDVRIDWQCRGVKKYAMLRVSSRYSYLYISTFHNYSFIYCRMNHSLRSLNKLPRNKGLMCPKLDCRSMRFL